MFNIQSPAVIGNAQVRAPSHRVSLWTGSVTKETLGYEGKKKKQQPLAGSQQRFNTYNQMIGLCIILHLSIHMAVCNTKIIQQCILMFVFVFFKPFIKMSWMCYRSALLCSLCLQFFKVCVFLLYRQGCTKERHKPVTAQSVHMTKCIHSYYIYA